MYMKSYNLQYYVDKLKSGERFSLARYGDGEMLCMWGKQGKNSNGCRYSPELREALLDSMKHKDDPSFIYGMQRVLPRDRERIEKEYPDVDWHDTEIFSEAVANGELYPLIEQLRKMRVATIYKRDPKHIINNEQAYITPPFDSYDEREQIKDFIKNSNCDVFLFSCGMGANAIIGELHGKVNAFLIDIGHIWDGFFGEMSRCDIEDKTIEDINKNLHEKTK